METAMIQEPDRGDVGSQTTYGITAFNQKIAYPCPRPRAPGQRVNSSALAANPSISVKFRESIRKGVLRQVGMGLFHRSETSS